jgi:hypothetical protein
VLHKKNNLNYEFVKLTAVMRICVRRNQTSSRSVLLSILLLDAYACLVRFSFYFVPIHYIFYFRRLFPEVYANGETPARCGDIDVGRYSTRTPCYRFGWVISRAELFEALDGEPCTGDDLLSRICIGASNRLYRVWKEKGYDKNEYK